MHDDPPAHRLPTIEAVAAAAGVSKTTVSHVLSGNRPVAAATRTKVERVVAELGYRPSAVARSLKIARSHTVAVVVPDVTNPFYPSLARGLQEAIGASGYLPLLAETGGDVATERAILSEMVQRRVDGLVISTSGLEEADLEEALRGRIAVVMVGPQLAGNGLDAVTADDERAAGDATAYLRARGRGPIATIAGPGDNTVAQRRLRGYLHALDADHADGEALIAHADFTREGGRAAMTDLLARERRPGAVLCANDLMAVGAMDAARAAGLAVPEDLAIMGIDDIEAAAMVSPALTTIRIPAHDIGRVAGELLLTRIAQPRRRAPRTVLVAHALVVRETA